MPQSVDLKTHENWRFPAENRIDELCGRADTHGLNTPESRSNLHVFVNVSGVCLFQPVDIGNIANHQNDIVDRYFVGRTRIELKFTVGVF